MGKVNVDQICEVRILNHTPHPHIEYKEAKGSFWGKREAGFYNTLSILGEELLTVEEIEKDGQLEHKVVGVTTRTGRSLLQKTFDNLTGSPSAVRKVGDDFVVKGNGRTIETFYKSDYKEGME